jgi:hypothetical protein
MRPSDRHDRATERPSDRRDRATDATERPTDATDTTDTTGSDTSNVNSTRKTGHWLLWTDTSLDRPTPPPPKRGHPKKSRKRNA